MYADSLAFSSRNLLRPSKTICHTRSSRRTCSFTSRWRRPRTAKDGFTSMCLVITCGGPGQKLRKFRASCDVGCLKPRHLHMSASTCDNKTHRQVSWFSDIVWILYNLNKLPPRVHRHVTTTWCATFHATSCIRPRHSLNIMNTIFWMMKFHYFMYLQFKFGIVGKIQCNGKN